MKKVTIKNKLGIAGWGAEMADPTAWIAECVASCAWGKPERWVLHKDEAASLEAYDDADVLEEEMRDTLEGVAQKWVKLKAEYTVEIEDITAQHALAEVIAKRVAEYPSAEEFLNAFFDGGQSALDALQAARLAVKAKYPKP
jgi:hypothetical protein